MTFNDLHLLQTVYRSVCRIYTVVMQCHIVAVSSLTTRYVLIIGHTASHMSRLITGSDRPDPTQSTAPYLTTTLLALITQPQHHRLRLHVETVMSYFSANFLEF